MKLLELYRGREQTYLKHFFLERYLERVAYNIGSSPSFTSLTYVDGFSGPWKSADDAFEDTSFMLAIRILRRVREGLSRIGRSFKASCIFIEKDPASFVKLRNASAIVKDFDIQLIHREFEDAIPAVLDLIGRSFSLTFVDPTGWTGFALNRIRPLLNHRPGEVIINFMYGYINRFVADPRPEVVATFDQLFGGLGWEATVRTPYHREEQIVSFYQERVRLVGDFAHVTHTCILKPISDRSYFYLVYGTRHPKGLLEFRDVEKKVTKEQGIARSAAKQRDRMSRTGQDELFDGSTMLPGSFEQEETTQLKAARATLLRLVKERGRISYEDARTILSEMPLLWESRIKRIILDLRKAKEIDIEGLNPPRRTPQPGHMLVQAK